MRAGWWLAPVAVMALSLSVACSGGDKKETADSTPAPSGDASATQDPNATPGASGTVDPNAVGTPTQFVQEQRTAIITVDLQENPCAMLSADEIKSASGGTVQSTDPIPDKAQPACRWVVDAESQGDVKVLQLRATAFANWTVYEASSRSGKVDISGIGDAAFALPMGTNSTQPGFVLWVKDGNAAFSIFVTPGNPNAATSEDIRLAFNDRALDVATKLAAIIASRL